MIYGLKLFTFGLLVMGIAVRGILFVSNVRWHVQFEEI